MKQQNLSLAIYWHMHQPVYELEGTYLMPWVRLHAVKDYLDMILVLEKFPNLKLNFNIVPALLDAIIDYTNNNIQDIHADLSLLDTNNLTEDEKAFILNNFFSAKYETMIFRSENYKNLYNKRFATDVAEIDNFSAQEISDLMALFNLVWIDTIHFERYPRLKELWNKQYNYTLEDRVEIINIHKQIMQEIIPTYKKYIKEGRIELTTSPYYHGILPILIDVKASIKSVLTTSGLPANLNMADDAKYQIRSALNRIEEIFGVRPRGIWPPELCIGSKTLSMLAKEGIKWAISDEGTLSNSIDFNFVRDFRGNINDPYHLLKVYNYQIKDKEINVIFRDRSIPNLINFEYAGMNTEIATKDLYDKIKTIQNKLLVSPDDSHLLTIALDCENCWENYQNDGYEFLDKFYSLIENDLTLETVLISEYIENDKYKKSLPKIYSGSWIDNTFQYWIGDVEKNKAWSYLKAVKEDYDEYANNNKNDKNLIKAKRELMIAQGSDWFWWFGEPNNSGQDFIFDYMFREHLKNVYLFLNLKPPKFLNQTIISAVEVPFKLPKNTISPRINGQLCTSDDWFDSGYISMLDGPVYRENKIIDKIYFGCDENNMYFRLHVNKNSSENNYIEKINQFYIYLRNATRISNRAYIRLINKTENPYPILTEKFEYELTLTLFKDILYPIRAIKVLSPNIWTLDNSEGINVIYNEVIDLSISFDKLNVKQGETVEFFMANTDSAVRNSYLAQEILLSVTRV